MVLVLGNLILTTYENIKWGCFSHQQKQKSISFLPFGGCDHDPNRLGALHGKILGGTPQMVIYSGVVGEA